jgi:hypothetical protein
MILMDESLTRMTTAFMSMGKDMASMICAESRMKYERVGHVHRGGIEVSIHADRMAGILVAVISDRRDYINYIYEACLQHYELSSDHVMMTHGGQPMRDDVRWDDIKVFLYNSALSHTVSVERLASVQRQQT